MRPVKSYAIWFSQRTGSTLLCKTLESTGIAGKPEEFFLDISSYFDPAVFQQYLWENDTTENGVFGVKLSMYKVGFEAILRLFRKLPGAQTLPSDVDVWNHAIPNCKHIFMTRRNKIRLAVSWWKAIQSGEWHREHGCIPLESDLTDKYSYDALNHLLVDCCMREAAIQEFFTRGDITPLTIVYEDFIRNVDETIKRILDFLEIEYDPGLHIESLHYERLADDISEEWVQRFRKERQAAWDNAVW